MRKAIKGFVVVGAVQVVKYLALRALIREAVKQAVKEAK